MIINKEINKNVTVLRLFCFEFFSAAEMNLVYHFIVWKLFMYLSNSAVIVWKLYKAGGSGVVVVFLGELYVYNYSIQL